MRWLLFGLLALSVLLPLGVVHADTSANVTVTAQGLVLGAPSNFTVTRVSDTEVLIDWTKNPMADKTMVRAKYGDYPEDRTDGYLVYYDTGESVTDESMSLDDTAIGIYYRAWSEDAGSVWSEEYAEGWTQGLGMTLIGIVILTLGLLGISIHYKNRALMMLAGSAGLALAIYGFTSMSSSGGDAFWVIGIIGAILTMVVVFMAGMSLRGIKGEEEPEDERYAREMREESLARFRAREERRRHR